MMNDKIKSLAEKSGIEIKPMIIDDIEYEYEIVEMDGFDDLKKFAELIVKECIDKIETYEIPCGNSPSGEMACEWTYDALKTIRDDIKETFGVE